MLEITEVFSSFSVDDLDSAREFYEKKLGLQVTEGSMGILNVEPVEGFRVVIYPKQNHIPATYTVLNFVVDDIDDAVDTMTQSGIWFEQYEGLLQTDEKGIARQGNRAMAWFKDPAGNFLSLMQEG